MNVPYSIQEKNDKIINEVVIENCLNKINDIRQRLIDDYGIYIGLNKISSIINYTLAQGLKKSSPIMFGSKIVEMGIDEMDYGYDLPQFKWSELSHLERSLAS